MGAGLTLESQPGAGARILLTVPATVAYARLRTGWLRALLG
jgi:hypothetical protein